MIDRMMADDGRACSLPIHAHTEIYRDLPSCAVISVVPRETKLTYLGESADLIAIAQAMRAQCPLLLAGASLSRLRPERDPIRSLQPIAAPGASTSVCEAELMRHGLASKMEMRFEDLNVPQMLSLEGAEFYESTSIEDRVHLIQIIERTRPELQFLVSDLLDSTRLQPWDRFDFVCKRLLSNWSVQWARDSYKLDGAFRAKKLKGDKSYTARNREKVNARSKRWASANSEKIRETYLKNRERKIVRMREYSRVRRARLKAEKVAL